MDEKLAKAASLFNNGNRLEAKKLLAEIINSDPSNSLAWYGMALCQEDTVDKILCLQRVVSLDPNNAKAKARLMDLLDKKTETETFYESPASSTKEKSVSKKPHLKILIIALGIGIGILLIAFLILFINSPDFPLNRKMFSLSLKNPCNQELLEEFLSTDILDLDMTIMQTSELWLDIGDSDLVREWVIQRKNESGCVVTMQVEQNGEKFDYIQYFIYLDSGRVTVENEEARILIKTFCSTPEKWGCLDKVRIISLVDPSTLSPSSIMARIPTIPSTPEKTSSPTPSPTPIILVEKTSIPDLASKYDLKVYNGLLEFDGFHNILNWGEEVTDSYIKKYENGKYLMQTLSPTHFGTGRPTGLNTKDIYLSVEVQSAYPLNEGDYAGILCGIENDTWYGFIIGSDSARIVKQTIDGQEDISVISDLANYSSVISSLNNESGSVRIGLVCNANYFLGTINEVVIVEGKDENNQFRSRQGIGLVVGSTANNLVKFYFDNLSVQVKSP